MYLTKLDVSVNRRTWGMLGNAHRMHSVLCRACGGTREAAGILYRVVPERQAVYVYSAVPLISAVLPVGVRIAGERDMSEVLSEIRDGQRLAFSLLAAPTKKVSNPTSHNSRRVFLRGAAERREWLVRKLTDAGCEVVHVQEGPDVTSQIYAKNKAPFRVTGVEYSGILEVRDPARFTEAMAPGIGAERAYGYGMLMVGGV